MRVALTRAAVSGATVGLAVLTMAATAQPAAADIAIFNDGGGHLTTVRVRHGSENLRVKANVGAYQIPSHFTFWLDTDRDDPGPEYKIKVYPNSEVLPIRAVESFADTGSEISCDYRASADAFSSTYVTIVVPRSCIGTPDAVGVSVKARYAVPGPNETDYGPARKKFFPAVAS